MEPGDAIVARLRAAGCVFAEDEARLLVDAATSAVELDRMVADRVAGTPLEQVVGWAEFCGLRLGVAPGVFVPRRRSEAMVEVAAGLVAAGAVVLDLCCGTGALGAALLTRVALGELHCVDIDPVAVGCARRNVPAAQVHEGDLYAPLPSALRGRVDLILANAPYVPTEAIALMPPEAREHEHRVALDGGTDGLDIQRAVIAAAPSWLSADGHVLVETSDEQAPVTIAVMRASGLDARVVTDDDRDATVAVGATARR